MTQKMAAPKPRSRRQSEKKHDAFLKGFLKAKLPAPKITRSADKWLSQPWCSHSNPIYDVQLQKRIILRMQPRRPHHVANLHLSTHMATPDDNNHAAIPMRSATTDSKHAKNYAHRNNHLLQNTEEEPITLGTTPAAPAAHRRYLSSPAATTLHGKNARLRAPAFSPTQAPCNIHAAITMHFAASCSKPASLYAWQHQMTTIMLQPFQCDLQPQIQNTQRTTHTGTTTGCRTQEEEPITLGTTPAAPCCISLLYLHGNTKWQQPCSHSNAICNHRFQNTHRTTHTGTTTCGRTQRRNPLRSERPQPHPPHTGGTFQCRLQPLQQTEKHTVSCSGFLPKSSLTPAFIECIVMRRQVSHHSLTPPFIECIVMWSKSHTTDSHHPSLSVLLQIRVIRNSEDCFPTRLKNIHHHVAMWTKSITAVKYPCKVYRFCCYHF